MSRIRNFFTMLFVLALGTMGTASADVNSVTPSTNATNFTNGWAHVVQVDVGIGFVDLEFISLRGFWSCFEYRTDGDASQSTGANYNPAVLDGLYPFTCENNSSSSMIITASQYVEVRMVFGAEKDERFDWTRFDVETDVQSKEECTNGGWEAFGFQNQGQCIKFVNTGKDSR